MLTDIMKCRFYRDERGDIIQFITKEWLEEHGISFGQVYLLTFNSRGVIRGNHYHALSVELFCLIRGKVEVMLEDSVTKETSSYIIESKAEEYQAIQIPPFVAHAIKCISEDAIAISFSTNSYNPDAEDKYPYPLM